MKLKVFSALAFLGVIACNDLTGTLTLRRDLNVVDKKGHTYTLQSGSYNSKLEYEEDNHRLDIKIKDAVDNKKDIEVRLQIPAGMEMPRESGPLVLAGALTGQSFDFRGDVNIDTVITPSESGYESCAYDSYEWVCRYDCNGYGRGWDRGRPGCYDYCGYEYVTRWGSRAVSFHTETTTTGVSGELMIAGTEENAGTLAVDRITNSKKIYDEYGDCRH